MTITRAFFILTTHRNALQMVIYRENLLLIYLKCERKCDFPTFVVFLRIINFAKLPNIHWKNTLNTEEKNVSLKHCAELSIEYGSIDCTVTTKWRRTFDIPHRIHWKICVHEHHGSYTVLSLWQFDIDIWRAYCEF